MLSFTTRNRPNVLAYSLRKTREHYDGFIVVIDDNSDDAHINEEIAKNYDCTYLYNTTRYGIPRSKERGFRSLLSFDQQFWFDDDCYPKVGWLDKILPAMQHQGHLLYLRNWTHIKAKIDYYNDYHKNLPGEVLAFTGATACFMSFRNDQYDLVKGFQAGFTKYGHWHSRLSQRLVELDEYVSIKNAQDYFHSFDVDGIPIDWKYSFQSCMSQAERKYELEKWNK